MKIKLLVIGLGMLFFIGMVFAELDPLVKYDNFNAKKSYGCKGCIDTQKWTGFEQGDYMAEILREVKSRKLHFTHRSWGRSDSDAGTEQGRNQLRFRNPEFYTGVCFTPRIKKYEINSCAANEDPGQVRIRYIGNFYDTDDNDDGDDGVVYAGIELIRNGNSESKASKFSIEGWASQCDGEDCEDPEPWSTSDDIDDPDLNFGTTKASKNKKALCIGYDRANHELVFTYGKDIRIVDAVKNGLPAFANDLTSSQAWHVIETVTDMPNCTASKLTGAVDGDVDDVVVRMPAYAIGDTGPAGGIVYHTSPNGTIGLEAASSDLTPTQWTDGTFLLTGANRTAQGTGAKNTADILAPNIFGVVHPAAKLADDYSQNGHHDWFLPSKDELALLYLRKDAVGGFEEDEFYWSSTELGRDKAHSLRFSDSVFGFSQKDTIRRVRPIRYFGITSEGFLLLVKALE